MKFININPDGTVTETTWEDFLKQEAERKKKRFAWFDGEYINIKTGRKDYAYDIPLTRCKTAAACLDWTHQISGKIWAWENPRVMKDFLEVLFETIPKSLWAGKG